MKVYIFERWVRQNSLNISIFDRTRNGTIEEIVMELNVSMKNLSTI